jgi:hypothetical protein
VKGGEGLELAQLLVQTGRGRADDEAVDALLTRSRVRAPADATW